MRFCVNVAEVLLGDKNWSAMQLTREASVRPMPGEEYTKINENLIAGCLQSANIIDHRWVVVALDSRMLRGPAFDRRLKRHCGFHPQTLADCARHCKFNDWLTRAMSLISDALEDESLESNIAVVAYCKAANHR